DIEHRRVRPRGDLAAALDRHAPAGNGTVAHPERHEPLLGPGGLDLAEPLHTGEVRIERACPAEAGRDRVPLRTDVVAVEREADLESQRVARPEPARRDTGREHRVPQADGVLFHARALDALLARVAGAVDHHLDAVDL